MSLLTRCCCQKSRNCGCRATKMMNDVTPSPQLPRLRCSFGSGVFGLDCRSCSGIGWLELCKCLPHLRLGRDVGDRFWGRDAGIRVRDLRRNDRREARVVSNTLRPFPIGMNADDGQIGICPVGIGQFRQYPSEMNTSASNTPPTKKKYRARGIRHSIRSLACTTGFQPAIIDRYQAPMRRRFVFGPYGPYLETYRYAAPVVLLKMPSYTCRQTGSAGS